MSTQSSRTSHTTFSIPCEQKEEPFSRRFFDKSNTVGRKIYFKVYIGGLFFVVLTIFCVLSIYWGSLWKSPDGTLKGWVVDFDGGLVGRFVSQSMTGPNPGSRVTWILVDVNEFPGGPAQVARAVIEQQAWAAITINQGASNTLQASYITPDPGYDGSRAMTFYGNEARNENAYRTLIRTSAIDVLDRLSQDFAMEAVASVTTSPEVDTTSLLSISPQTIIKPIYYTIDNLIPFDIPVASAVTFVGLIYLLILSFFVVMIGYSAREAAGLNRNLMLRSLIATRFASSFTAYFFVSFFYSVLTLAFQLNFHEKFGVGGFPLFWMLNWVGMLSVGMALEALITLLTTSFTPFFMILWIIVNVCVCILPLEVLPPVFRYGYAAPFYNISHAARAIVFGTKNSLSTNFAVLLTWIGVSCTTMPLIQWLMRQKARVAVRRAAGAASSSSDGGEKVAAVVVMPGSRANNNGYSRRAGLPVTLLDDREERGGGPFESVKCYASHGCCCCGCDARRCR